MIHETDRNNNAMLFPPFIYLVVLDLRNVHLFRPFIVTRQQRRSGSSDGRSQGYWLDVDLEHGRKLIGCVTVRRHSPGRDLPPLWCCTGTSVVHTNVP